eukprot:TRINITY_DN5745_c0_g1_i1.p2 TRINITY_DN5745_c0_g1~~TRINITY_DN5745_c0_g1_i1.p2  ORF type:complete len:109 (-),score=4.95 TRINITY_DN5745_c0_g1_i1:34-360(-)
MKITQKVMDFTRGSGYIPLAWAFGEMQPEQGQRLRVSRGSNVIFSRLDADKNAPPMNFTDKSSNFAYLFGSVSLVDLGYIAGLLLDRRCRRLGVQGQREKHFGRHFRQ